MSWQQATLGNLVSEFGGLIQTGPFGSQLKQSEYAEEGVPVIMPTNIFDGRVNIEKIARVPDATAARLARHRIKPDTIVFPRRGEITKRAYITEDQTGWICGTGCLKIEAPETVILPKFLYYQMGTDDSVDWLQKNAVGATMLNLSGEILARYPVRFPDLPTQQRIAGILSAYDDLIENNRRRIGLLEQAARLLYREWFVHLRFPGHETAKFVDGLPEGWRILTVEESVKRLPPGKLFSQATASAKGAVPILDQGKSGQLGFHDEQPSFVASVDDPVIVFANHTCYQRVIHFSFSAIQNVLPFKPSSNAPNEIYWLHHATLGLVKLNAYKGHWPEFKIKEIPVPNANIAARFSELVRPMHAQMHELEMLNSKLTRARDLLLPRLMDGRIPV